MDLKKIAGAGPCPCGRPHEMWTKEVVLGKGALKGLGQALNKTGIHGHALLVADENTWSVAGSQAEEALRAAGCEVSRFVFRKQELHTDEFAVGSVFMAMDDRTEFLAAVGSGTVNDICRFVAKRTGLPYIVIGTAPSMDGYASAVSPIVRGGFKMTWPGVAPTVIVGDTEFLKGAPLNMMAAGLGDVFGKFTSLLDWQMANRLLGEYRCARVADTMKSAVDACMAAAPGLPGRDESAVEGLMGGLVLAGLAMQMVGDSRPASGSEHHVAHFLEMRDMTRGKAPTLHGDKVGMAELVMMRLYEKFFSGAFRIQAAPPARDAHAEAMKRDLGAFGEMLLGENCSAMYYDKDGKPDAALMHKVLEGIATEWDYWQAEAQKLPALRLAGEESIRKACGPVRPKELGYTREDIRLAILYAMELRDKFTILRLAHLTGRLPGLAEELADEFCK